jgi:hypothetical protein
MPNITIERFKRLPLDPADIWEGGLFSMPSGVEGPDGKPYRLRMALAAAPYPLHS